MRAKRLSTKLEKILCISLLQIFDPGQACLGCPHLIGELFLGHSAKFSPFDNEMAAAAGWISYA